MSNATGSMKNLPKINVQPVIISYNNPIILQSTLDKFSRYCSSLLPVFIFENGSTLAVKEKVSIIAEQYCCKVFNCSTNLGWGGAVNYILDYHWNELNLDQCILLIMAHDCYFVDLDIEEIGYYFSDPSAIFVCPQYPKPIINYYNVFKSYYSKPGRASGLIKIGHQTAFFARPNHLKQVRFDQEFWLYGGEYEIFTRAHQAGFRSYQAEHTVIVNPSSDTSSETCLLAYKLNSLYCAYKRHGHIGLYLRSLVITFNVFALYFFADRRTARYLLQCVRFGIANPGCGHHSYRSSLAHQIQYKILPLNH